MNLPKCFPRRLFSPPPPPKSIKVRVSGVRADTRCGHTFQRQALGMTDIGGFSLLFAGDQCPWESLPLFLCQWCPFIAVVEVTLKIFVHVCQISFCNRCTVSYLYIQNKSLLSDTCFANSFSQFDIIIMVSFERRKFITVFPLSLVCLFTPSLGKLYQTVIYSSFHLWFLYKYYSAAWYYWHLEITPHNGSNTHFSQAEIFTEIGDILGHKANAKNGKIIENVQSIFSDHTQLTRKQKTKKKYI